MKSTKRKISVLALLLCFLCCFAVRPVLAAEGADSSARILSCVDSSGEHFAKARSYGPRKTVRRAPGQRLPRATQRIPASQGGFPSCTLLFLQAVWYCQSLCFFSCISQKRESKTGERSSGRTHDFLQTDFELKIQEKPENTEKYSENA